MMDYWVIPTVATLFLPESAGGEVVGPRTSVVEGVGVGMLTAGGAKGGSEQDIHRGCVGECSCVAGAPLVEGAFEPAGLCTSGVSAGHHKETTHKALHNTYHYNINIM